jgi:hypothetical protein|tara:strand:+ start:103 stop:261 length:159 start_codon:yes stop_codon:yes gene_type:complete
MWKLILKKEIGDVEINSYPTKKEAQEELANREQLTLHLTGHSTRGIYEIQKG